MNSHQLRAIHKYQIIESILSLYTLKLLCKIAKVSVSGYYCWKNRILKNKDKEIISIISQIFFQHNGKIGIRRIKMELERNYNLIVNKKKIQRIKKQDGAILHSDRGGLYTSFQYIQKLKELNLTRSMSRSGNCLDNAPIESFFGHLKDEVEYKECKTLEEIRDKIDIYIYYYNTRRYQWGLNKMTPNEFRQYLQSSY